jgi:hypothetical protein
MQNSVVVIVVHGTRSTVLGLEKWTGAATWRRAKSTSENDEDKALTLPGVREQEAETKKAFVTREGDLK